MMERSQLYKEDLRNQRRESPSRSVWLQIEENLAVDRLDQAFNLGIHCPDDAVLIKLMNRTGICLDQLDAETINLLTQRILAVLTTKEFTPQLLPWITNLSEILTRQNREVKG